MRARAAATLHGREGGISVYGFVFVRRGSDILYVWNVWCVGALCVECLVRGRTSDTALSARQWLITSMLASLREREMRLLEAMGHYFYACLPERERDETVRGNGSLLLCLPLCTLYTHDRERERLLEREIRLLERERERERDQTVREREREREIDG